LHITLQYTQTNKQTKNTLSWSRSEKNCHFYNTQESNQGEAKGANAVIYQFWYRAALVKVA